MSTKQVMARIDAGGRVLIPSEHRKALGMKPGDKIMLVPEEGALRIMSIAQAVKRAQALVRRYVPKGTMLSEELIAERRAEAKRE